MTHTIAISEPTFERLREEAQRVNTSPSTLAEQLLAERLRLPWEAELAALLARVRARTAAFPSDEIETDITRAAAEAKADRRARRSD